MDGSPSPNDTPRDEDAPAAPAPALVTPTEGLLAVPGAEPSDSAAPGPATEGLDSPTRRSPRRLSPRSPRGDGTLEAAPSLQRLTTDASEGSGFLDTSMGRKSQRGKKMSFRMFLKGV